MKSRKTAAKKKPGVKRAVRAAARDLPEAYYGVHALWVAVRALSAREDELCQLMHAIKREGRVSGEVRAELRALLNELAAGDVMDAMKLVEAELPTPAGRRS